jgi:hypothetical protein
MSAEQTPDAIDRKYRQACADIDTIMDGLPPEVAAAVCRDTGIALVNSYNPEDANYLKEVVCDTFESLVPHILPRPTVDASPRLQKLTL